MKNYYEILEVNPKASKEVIDKAYKVLIKKYHPDLYNEEKQQYAEKKTKEINEAYRVLSDEFLKEQYDSELEKQTYSNTARMQNSNTTKTKEQKTEKRKRKNKVGTLESMTDLVKRLIEIIKNKEKREQVKEITRKDIFAFVLTIVIVIIIGIILWFIPFTNGWMRELLFENPLFSWIGMLFG